jgi:glycosyltransferase involved in cell wall biosynthesis
MLRQKELLRVGKHAPNPIPVLLVVRELGSGGIERDVAKLAKRLPRDRFVPYVATYKPIGPRFEELKDAGIPILHLKVSSLKSPRAAIEAMRLAWFILKRRIRVVHAWDASAVFVVPIARLLRVPVVLSSMLGSRELLDMQSRKQLQFTDRLVDAIVVNCEAMRKHLKEDCGVPPDKIDICYNGVDTNEFYPSEEPRPPELADASLVIGTVCVLRVEKALELLIEAFAQIRNRAPALKLLIVGSGPELQKLQKLTATLELTRDCLFVPAVRDVARYIRAIDIFVSTSYSEAFSNSILEAMACGCCVVATRVGGTPELIEDGQRGLLFESGNSAELADRLAGLIDEPCRRQQFAQNAAVFARTKLNMDIATQTMTSIYESMLQRKTAA